MPSFMMIRIVWIPVPAESVAEGSSYKSQALVPHATVRDGGGEN